MEPQKPTIVLPAIPARSYFAIDEASVLCGVKPHVLRYWEQEFAQLQPIKRRGNRRYYRHSDLLRVRHIRELLYDQGYTISGARDRLATEAQAALAAGTAAEEDVSTPAEPRPPADGAMRFSVSCAELSRRLRLAVGVTGHPRAEPVLEDFLLKVESGRLTISATDLETRISTSMDVQAASDFAVSVPAEILLKTLEALPDQTVTFSVDKAHDGVEITSSFGTYHLAADKDVGLFDAPSPDPARIVLLGNLSLRDAINKTVFAAQVDGEHRVFAGVHFEVAPERLTCIATDGHRLARFSTRPIEGEGAGSFIVPKRALEHLKAILPREVAVELCFDETHAAFRFGTTQLMCALIQEYPVNYKAVIPSDRPSGITLDRRELLGSLQRISFYAGTRNYLCHLDISESRVTVSGADADHSHAATEHFSCVSHGSPMRMDVNVRLLIEMVAALDGDAVELTFNHALEPLTLHPVQEAGSDSQVLMVLMPLRSDS